MKNTKSIAKKILCSALAVTMLSATAIAASAATVKKDRTFTVSVSDSAKSICDEAGNLPQVKIYMYNEHGSENNGWRQVSMNDGAEKGTVTYTVTDTDVNNHYTNVVFSVDYNGSVYQTENLEVKDYDTTFEISELSDETMQGTANNKTIKGEYKATEEKAETANFTETQSSEQNFSVELSEDLRADLGMSALPQTSIYLWNSDTKHDNGAFGSVQMSQNQVNPYSATYTTATSNGFNTVIFSVDYNGSVYQTENITLPSKTTSNYNFYITGFSDAPSVNGHKTLVGTMS